MTDTIYIKSGELGDRKEMPALKYDSEKGSEVAYQTEEEALYIGTQDGNKRLCGAKDIGDINTRLNAINASISSINAQIKDIDSQIAEIISRLDASSE